MVSGTSNYGTNLPLNSLNGPRISSFNEVRLFQELYGNAFTPPESTFEVQNLNFSTQASYHHKHFYVQGQIYFSYTVPAAYSGWHCFYNLSTGLSF
jgi:hypothetical protein